MSYTNPRKINRNWKIQYKENWAFHIRAMAKAIQNGDADLAGENASKAFHYFKLAR